GEGEGSGVATVFIREYVGGKWWEHLLHNQSALRLKGRLLFEPGVMVTSVPWQLQSTTAKDLERLDRGLSRDIARGPRSDPADRGGGADGGGSDGGGAGGGGGQAGGFGRPGP